MKQTGKEAQPPASGAHAAPPPAAVVLIDSDEAARAATGEWLRGWGLEVIEADLQSLPSMTAPPPGAAAVIADFELGHERDWPLQRTGLDLALAVARRAGRAMPTLMLSSDFGRNAIRACSAYHFVVLFKPLAPELLYRWLVEAALLPACTGVAGAARSAARCAGSTKTAPEGAVSPRLRRADQPRRRRMKPSPARPAPSTASEAGSGTDGGLIGAAPTTERSSHPPPAAAPGLRTFWMATPARVVCSTELKLQLK